LLFRPQAESTWSLGSPQTGKFEYSWMARASTPWQGRHQVIMGTPINSVPTWMVNPTPESSPLVGPGHRNHLRHAQNWTPQPHSCTYARRVITNRVLTTATTPPSSAGRSTMTNGSYGAYNDDVFAASCGTSNEGSLHRRPHKAWFLTILGPGLNGWNIPSPRPRHHHQLQARVVVDGSSSRVTDFPRLAKPPSSPAIPRTQSVRPLTTTAA